MTILSQRTCVGETTSEDKCTTVQKQGVWVCVDRDRASLPQSSVRQFPDDVLNEQIVAGLIPMNEPSAPSSDALLDDNDNDNDHSFSQLPKHKALTCPKGQSAWAVAAKEIRSVHRIIHHGALVAVVVAVV